MKPSHWRIKPKNVVLSVKAAMCASYFFFYRFSLFHLILCGPLHENGYPKYIYVCVKYSEIYISTNLFWLELKYMWKIVYVIKGRKRECMMRTLWRLCVKGSTVVWMCRWWFLLLSVEFVVHVVTFAFLAAFRRRSSLPRTLYRGFLKINTLNWIRSYTSNPFLVLSLSRSFHIPPLFSLYLEVMFKDASVNTLHGASVVCECENLFSKRALLDKWRGERASKSCFQFANRPTEQNHAVYDY